MTSRERILATIEHRQPDRVPVDLGATPSSGISAIAYGNLKRHLGLQQGRTLVYDVVQQLAQPEDFVLDRFRVDVIDIGRSFNTEPSAWQPTVLSDGQTAMTQPGSTRSANPTVRSSPACRTDSTLRICRPAAPFTTKAISLISMATPPISATCRRKWDGFFGRRWFTAPGTMLMSPGFGTLLRANALEFGARPTAHS